jgi:hypothetical protein
MLFYSTDRITTAMEKETPFRYRSNRSRALPGGWVFSSHNGSDIVGILNSISHKGLTFHHAGKTDCTKMSTINIYLEGPTAISLKNFPCRTVSDRVQSVVGNTTLKLCKVQFEMLSPEQETELERILGV